MSMKNPPTPAEIEPATFRFVAQYLNHCATAAPHPLLAVGTDNAFPASKAEGPWSREVSSNQRENPERVEPYLHYPICLHGVYKENFTFTLHRDYLSIFPLTALLLAK